MTTQAETASQYSGRATPLVSTEAGNRAAGSSYEQISHGSWSLLDQGLVSGASFATVILIQRFAGTSELGLYAITNSLLLLLAGLQVALVTSPLTVFLPKRDNASQSRLLGSALIQHTILVPVVVAASLTVWVLLKATSNPFGPLVLASTVAMAGLLLRDFARRVSFATLYFHRAASLDFAAMALRFTGFAMLIQNGALTSVTCFAAIGLADIIASLVWLSIHRRVFKFCRTQFVHDTRNAWEFGRWGVFSQSLYLGQTHGVHWLIAAFCGVAATGIYSMCSSVVQLAGPLIQGAGNAIGPILANSFAKTGKRSLQTVVNRCSLLLLSSSLIYLTVIWLVSDDLLHLLFDEKNIESSWPVVAFLSLGTAANIIALPATKAIGVLEKPSWNFITNAIGLLVTFSMAGMAAANGNLMGAAFGVSCGWIVALILRWTIYVTLLYKSEEPVR